jgi:REP element-mobilizing transposase RayT
MANIRISLEPEKCYHIYNHSCGSEDLFRNDGNYIYFLKKYEAYLSPVFETFAYCLMPNHFHFMVKVRSEEIIVNYFKSAGSEDFHKDAISNALTHQVGSFFNAYTKAYNKAFSRRGSLFVQSFRRKHINDNAYFKKLVHYIHHNPVHHCFVNDVYDWKYSSFHSIISDKETFLEKEQVIEFFGSREDFIEFHQDEADLHQFD